MKTTIAQCLRKIIFSGCISFLSVVSFAQQDHYEADVHQQETHASDTGEHADMGHADMDHGEMNHSEMNHSNMDHEEMNHEEMDHSKMNYAEQDHSQHSAQPMAATDTLRDPHAYSGGYQVGHGDYALPDHMTHTMADQHNFWAVAIHRFEMQKNGAESALNLAGKAWYGNSYKKWIVYLEGESAAGEVEHLKIDALWSRAVSPYWDTQLGVRVEDGEGPRRTWLAFGIEGLAPYWFEMGATGFVGDGGRTALQLEVEYEFHITQRWVLKPSGELSAYGKDDVERGIGSGVSSLEMGLRLHYDVTPQISPYVGMEWTKKYANTADLARDNNQDTRATAWVVGLSTWF